jgi:hypothetical protein
VLADSQVHARGRVPVCAQRVRVLAAPDALPHSGLQGQGQVPAQGESTLHALLDVAHPWQEQSEDSAAPPDREGTVQCVTV